MNKIIAFAAICLICSPSFALYKCKIDGKTVYQDTKCEIDSKKMRITAMEATDSTSTKIRAMPVHDSYQPHDEVVQKSVPEAKTLLKSILKDPGSAKFSSERVLRFTSFDEEMELVCFYVNAKNSYGMYVGKKLYGVLNQSKVYDEDKATSFERDGVFFVTTKALRQCLAEGKSLN